MAEGSPWGADRDDGRGQRELAELLVATLGRDGAIHACQGNAWYGVLEWILNSEGAAKPR
jgi:hypothetical protein